MQIFFSSFYKEYNKGKDNTEENTKYNSKMPGYYYVNSNYVLTEYSINGTSVKRMQRHRMKLEYLVRKQQTDTEYF